MTVSREEVEAHHQKLAMRYRKAFAKSKVNWLKVKFDPITPIYVEQKAEQNILQIMVLIFVKNGDLIII